ncbi:hypothetical protein LXL04_004119 [Taraxacum kok-saghyz]
MDDIRAPIFLSRLQGQLQDWYNNLGEDRQLTIQRCETPEAFMILNQIEFVGNPVEHTIQAREEFLKMKC